MLIDLVERVVVCVKMVTNRGKRCFVEIPIGRCYEYAE